MSLENQRDAFSPTKKFEFKSKLPTLDLSKHTNDQLNSSKEVISRMQSEMKRITSRRLAPSSRSLTERKLSSINIRNEVNFL